MDLGYIAPCPVCGGEIKGYFRFDVFSYKTSFSGGDEHHACVL